MQSKLTIFFENYIVPSISVILIGIFTWIYFTRVDKLELLVSSLNNSVIKMEVLVCEMDKALSSNSMTHTAIIEDVTSIKQEVASLKAIVEIIKNHL